MAQFIYPPVSATLAGGATEATLLNVEAELVSIDAKVLTDTQLRASPVPVSGPLTDAQLRATAVPVSGPLTDTQLRATAVPISGTVTANTGLSQPLTDAQLRATAVPVSGPLTDSELRATAVPVSGPLTDSQLRATAVPVSGPLTDTQLRATAVPVSGPLTDAQLRATAVPVVISTSLDVVDQIDTTPLLDTSSTNIPASSSSPLEIVASSAAVIKKIITVEDIGSFIGLYTGPASSEVLKAVLPLGGGEVELNIAAGVRISLRAMENSAINSGKIAINFLG